MFSFEHWYHPDDLPTGRLVVRVWWMAHGLPSQFKATRLATRAGWQWFADLEDGLTEIPPRGREKAYWHTLPECWQPLELSKWTWPGGVPKPLAPHQVPRLSSTTMLFSALDEATDAEIAAERQSDREAAQARQDDADEIASSRWWRNPFNVKYEDRGSVLPRNCEGRVMRVMAHCGAGNDRRLGQIRSNQALAQVIADTADSAKADVETSRLARFQPLPRDHQDFDMAMSWVAALNPPELRRRNTKGYSLNRAQEVLLLRALDNPWSFRDIGEWFGFGEKVARQQAHRMYRAAVSSCCRVANGHPAYRQLHIADQIRLLQERNREFKRSEHV